MQILTSVYLLLRVKTPQFYGSFYEFRFSYMYYDDYNFYKCINIIIVIITTTNTMIAVDFILYNRNFLLTLD